MRHRKYHSNNNNSNSTSIKRDINGLNDNNDNNNSNSDYTDNYIIDNYIIDNYITDNGSYINDNYNTDNDNDNNNGYARDSLEDDYYGCEAVQPELNVMETENFTLLPGIQSTTTIKPFQTSTMRPELTKKTSCRPNYTPPSKNTSQKASTPPRVAETTTCRKAVTPLKTTVSPQYLTVHYEVFDESPRTKSNTIKVPKSNTIPEKRRTETQKSPGTFSPRCFEKTIDIEKITPNPQDYKLAQQLFKTITTSTHIIWVGNTFPDGIKSFERIASLDETLR
ncbi:unnamed protein product [Chrysodeixis includens]|uniref:Uncharacterized protein n=1 Tax=Chrysodeixis includens TaxID=689277 RepID=A0A9N8PZR1_CHRIL|nr:unnamed protein product [Chrysodeixis includens]